MDFARPLPTSIPIHEQTRTLPGGAQNARQARWIGDIVLIQPISYTLLTAFSVSIAVLVLIFTLAGSYTERSAVAGILVPDAGLVKILPPQSGIVLEKHVVEGAQVKKGDVLYVLSNERQSSTAGEVQASISGQIEERRQSLQSELSETRKLQHGDREALVEKFPDARRIAHPKKSN